MLTHSFTGSLVCLLAVLFTRWFDDSFIHWFADSFIRRLAGWFFLAFVGSSFPWFVSFLNLSFTVSLVLHRSFFSLVRYLFIRWFAGSPIRSSARSLVRPPLRPFTAAITDTRKASEQGKISATSLFARDSPVATI